MSSAGERVQAGVEYLHLRRRLHALERKKRKALEASGNPKLAATFRNALDRFEAALATVEGANVPGEVDEEALDDAVGEVERVEAIVDLLLSRGQH